MKKIITSLFLMAIITATSNLYAESVNGNFTIGIGPAGNIYLVDSKPELDPGVGGHIFFDYRWSPQFSTQLNVLVTTQDGKGPNSGDKDILFMGLPSFDLKFYLFSEPSRWDPYGLIGVGMYLLSEGTVENGSFAIGMGADIGVGCDYYLTEKFSVGLSAIFRGIALIDSVDGPNNGTSQFPLSLMGNVAYHF